MGVIDKIGPNVKKLKEGDVSTRCSCTQCFLCLREPSWCVDVDVREGVRFPSR